MSQNFHPSQAVARGVRLRVVWDDFEAAKLRSEIRCQMSSSLLSRLISVVLTLLLFLSSSPVLFASMARDVIGGGGSAGGKGGAANLQNAGAASASLTAARARAVLKQTDAQVAALKALQNNARSMMSSGGIPNGLTLNGLNPYNPSGLMNPNATTVPKEWSGVGSLNQSGNTVTVSQNSQNAYLYWNQFNVGQQTTLNFDQSAGGTGVGNWIAFNKVMGNVSPSHIYGQITAQGQVYILNQNGILFHNGSQVNTHALVASTLPINPYLAGDPLNGITGVGIVNNAGYQFLFSALKLNNSTSAQDGFIPNPTDASGSFKSAQIGAVIVEPGATISTPVSSANTGGRVMLVGSSVVNNGSISTPNGQTIMAAGLQVGVNPHPSSDPTLRGLDVYVGQVSDAAGNTLNRDGYQVGTVVNNGVISIPEADLAMAGRFITQNGAIDSSTSVSLNGRVDILAAFNATLSTTPVPYLYYNASASPGINGTTGSVDFGSGSVVRILPEYSSADKVTGSSLALPSLINIKGQSIRMKSGATIFAPGANKSLNSYSPFYDMTYQSSYYNNEPSTAVTPILGASPYTAGININAGNYYTPNNKLYSYFQLGALPSQSAAGKILIDSGALISVAGSTDINVDSSKNFLKVQLRGSELANSPLQRTGVIRGASLTLDARITGTYNGQYWIGTPLGDASGFVGLIEHTVGELTAAGGTIAMNAGDVVNLNQGATLDVSGGWVQYAGGFGSTSKLMYQGHLVDVSRATPDRIYSGIYQGGGTVESNAKWGVTKTFSMSPLDPTKSQYQAAYMSGAAGGSIVIQAPSIALNGTVFGTVVNGPRQVRYSSSVSLLPSPSSLDLEFTDATGGSPIYKPSVQFGYGGVSTTQKQSFLDAGMLSSSGLGNLVVYNPSGSLDLPNSVDLTLPPGSPLPGGISTQLSGANGEVTGGVSLTAANVAIDGKITVPGGAISVTALYSSDESGLLHLKPDASLSTAGLVLNEGKDTHIPIVLNGGSISLEGNNVLLDKGSVLDVSGGALLGAPPVKQSSTGPLAAAPGTATTIYGNAGSISITGGLSGGSLQMNSTLKGYAGIGASSGALSISAPAIQIGGSVQNPRILSLTPDFFNKGGFSSFSLTGMGISTGLGLDNEIAGIRVVSGAVIDPIVQNMLLLPNGQKANLLQMPNRRPAPSLALNSTGLIGDDLFNPVILRGNTVIEAGSQIILNPQLTWPSELSTVASVNTGSLTINGKVTKIDGSLSVPGGTITLNGASTYPKNYNGGFPPIAIATLTLGSSASVSAAGETLTIPDPLPFQRKLGAVLPGGSVALSGNILLQPGSLVDVSGATGQLYIHSEVNNTATEPRTVQQLRHFNNYTKTTTVDSSGGKITLTGSQFVITQGGLLGRSGGSTATGGSLTVSSGLFYSNPQDNPGLDLNRFKLNISQALSGLADAQQVSSLYGGGFIAAKSIMEGGFDSATLKGTVNFKGPVSLSLPGSLSVAQGGMIQADAKVNLAAPYVAIGTPFIGPLGPQDINGLGIPAAPSFGPGSLTVQARILDIGNLLLRNIGMAKFNVSGGMVRGNGTLDIAGDLSISSAQVSPVTAAAFSLVARDHGGTPGSIRVEQAGGPLSLPLSAAGTISLFASSIMQNGTLVAPFGTINLGGSGTDPITGTPYPAAEKIILGPNSVTSVSAIDPTTGEGITIPYGIIINGTDWIDPSGNNITTKGLPPKAINISAASVTTSVGSTIDLRGGGNLVAYSWINGLQGTVDPLAQPSVAINRTVNVWGQGIAFAQGQEVTYNGSVYVARQDIGAKSAGSLIAPNSTSSLGLSLGSIYWTKISSKSYAILPGYNGDALPVAPFADSSKSGGDPGYTSSSLSVGDKITLAAGSGLPAGTYTLLPSRYAVLPGAYLITPTGKSQENQPTSASQPDGSTLVAGYRYNNLNASRTIPTVTSLFEVDSPKVIASKANYQLSLASVSLPSSQAASPVNNAASLVIQAITAMNLLGGVMGNGANGGRGANIDLSSSANFLVGNASSVASAGTILLNSSVLSGWNAGSLLIGGTRSVSSSGMTVTPATSQITLDNSGSTLTASDIILVSKNAVILKSGSSLAASSDQSASPLSVSGNGALVRVSTDQSASVTRTGNDNTAVTGYSIGAGANLSGGSISLDSSGNASIAPSAILNAETINLSAGKMALNFDGSSQLGALNLAGSALQSLSKVQALNLKSYSSIEFHGSGVLGSASLASLGIHAGELLGDNVGADTILASSILLDNSGSSTDPSAGAPVATGGSLSLAGSVLTLGSGALSIGGFQNVGATMSGGIQTTGKGVLTVAQNLSLSAPVITGAGAAATSIKAGGVLNITDPGTAALTPGLGASLSLQGSSVSISAPIQLPSGSLSVRATSGDLTIASKLDVGGVSRQFFDVTKYTDAGSISLSSDNGNLILIGATLNLSAQKTAGNAGSLTLNAPKGIAQLNGSIDATAPKGTAGSFTADFNSYGVGDLTVLEGNLTDWGFTQSQNIRLRNGDVTVGNVRTHSYTLSADQGSIVVNGTINASGTTGGSISLFAGKSLILESGAVLDAHGQQFDNAGKGGSIDLEAGNSLSAAVIDTTPQLDGNGKYTAGSVVDLTQGTIDLYVGIDATHQLVPSLGQASGTLHLRAPQTTDNSDVQVNPIAATITGASAINVEGFFRQDAATVGNAEIDPGTQDPTLDYQNNALNNANLFMGNYAAIGNRITVNGTINASLVQVNPGEEIVNSLGGLVLNNDWDLSQVRNGEQITLLNGNQTRKIISAGNVINGVNQLNSTLYYSTDPNGTGANLALSNSDLVGSLYLNGTLASLDQINGAFANQGLLSCIVSGSIKNFTDANNLLVSVSPNGVLNDGSGNQITTSDGAVVPVSVGLIGKSAGYLTLKALTDVTLLGSISDGFGDSLNNAKNSGGLNYGLYSAPLLPVGKNSAGAIGSQTSWNYSITSGSDMGSANPLSTATLAGNVNIGKLTATSNIDASDPTGFLNKTTTSIKGNYQALRTGTGSINVSAADSIRLLNQFATIYTAGTQVTDPTLGGTFDIPNFYSRSVWDGSLGLLQQRPFYGAPQYSYMGGNVSLKAGADIAHLQGMQDPLNLNGPWLTAPDGSYLLQADSSRETPSSWLSRSGYQDISGNWGALPQGGVATTTWWINFGNFFEGVGALGGGNVSMIAGGNVSNVDGLVPTQGRLTKDGKLAETGGGDLLVKSGQNIDAGMYYIERGNAAIHANGSIVSNPTRNAQGLYLNYLIDPFANAQYANTDPSTWIPTTFVLGKGNMSVSAGGDALLGGVANAFLLPTGINNGLSSKSYFASYNQLSEGLDGKLTQYSSSFTGMSLDGKITFETTLNGNSLLAPAPPLTDLISLYQPWTRTSEFNPKDNALQLASSLLPPQLQLTSFAGSIAIQGNLLLSPARNGNFNLISQGAISGFGSSIINISDASLAAIPTVTRPVAQAINDAGDPSSLVNLTHTAYLSQFTTALSETGGYQGFGAPNLQTQLLLHDSSILHSGDKNPVRIYSVDGALTGIQLFSPKITQVLAGDDISNVSFYIQNVAASDVSLVSSLGNINLYQSLSGIPSENGDIQISGPGTLEVTAGRNINLGTGSENADGTGLGITSIGNTRNPKLSSIGADVVVAAGINLPTGLEGLNYKSLIQKTEALPESVNYYSELMTVIAQGGADNLVEKLTQAGSLSGISSSSALSSDEKARLALDLFYIVLRDAGRDHNKVGSTGFGNYNSGEEAIKVLFDGSYTGNIVMNARDIRTKNGGGINILTPGGGISMATYSIGASAAPPGIVTEAGGGINIYSLLDVSIGNGRIFTLRGGDIMIWSEKGDIAAGHASKTVASAPPTRVLIDSQSANVLTDLSGLATGGGIGVLATVKDAPVGNVDLIAPSGVIDAGDAGIRSSGNLNLAATKILNADNIAVSGTTAGAPPAPPPPAAPNVSGATAAAAAGAASTSTAATAANNNNAATPEPPASIISVEVLGYGGGDTTEDSTPAPTTSSGSTPPPQAAL